jgi:hypothetical protein
MGHKPGPLSAETLTAAADQALAAASALQVHNATELRMLIYPGPYLGGPSFDVTGDTGDLSAAGIHSPNETFHGETLEDLAGSIRQARSDGRQGFRLVWMRKITAPTACTPLAAQLPPGE